MSDTKRINTEALALTRSSEALSLDKLKETKEAITTGHLNKTDVLTKAKELGVSEEFFNKLDALDGSLFIAAPTGKTGGPVPGPGLAYFIAKAMNINLESGLDAMTSIFSQAEAMLSMAIIEWTNIAEKEYRSLEEQASAQFKQGIAAGIGAGVSIAGVAATTIGTGISQNVVGKAKTELANAKAALDGGQATLGKDGVIDLTVGDGAAKTRAQMYHDKKGAATIPKNKAIQQLDTDDKVGLAKIDADYKDKKMGLIKDSKGEQIKGWKADKAEAQKVVDEAKANVEKKQGYDDAFSKITGMVSGLSQATAPIGSAFASQNTLQQGEEQKAKALAEAAKFGQQTLLDNAMQTFRQTVSGVNETIQQLNQAYTSVNSALIRG